MLFRFAWLFILVSSSMLESTLTLINDSAFPLEAVISNAMGDVVDRVALKPGETRIWDHDFNTFKTPYNMPYTPYTVRWLCNTDDRPYDYNVRPKKDKDSKEKKEVPPKYESEYGNWTNVPTGATLNAQKSPNGTKSCVIKKKKEKPEKGRKFQHAWSIDGGQTWVNDGGETWINDGGSPFFDNEPGNASGT